MGVSNADLDALEEQRLTLEDNILKLQKSLYHWRTWEAEYDGLREEISNLPNDALAEEVLAVGREFGGTLVNEEEVRVILGGKDGLTRSRTQVVDILGRRIDYVKQNIGTMEKRLRAAEDELDGLDDNGQASAQGETSFPMSEIMEELDEEGRVISSSVNTPGDDAPQLWDALKKAGVRDIPDGTAGETGATGGSSAVRESVAQAPAQSAADPEIATHDPHSAPEESSTNVDDEVDLSRPVSLVTEEDRKQPPVSNVNESTEDAKLRREMFQYGIDEVGAIVAELEMDEDASDVSVDEDYEYQTDDDDDEDEFGRSYPVLSEDYHQQMRELEAKLNARGMWNMGKDSQSLPADVREEVDTQAVEQSGPVNGSVDEPVKEKKPKKRVAFADDLDIAPAPNPPVAEKRTLPPLSDIPVLSDSIVERTDNPQDTRPAATEAPKKVSRFKSARDAAPESDVTDNTSTRKPSQFAEYRGPRKQTNAAPSSVPPPLFPATPKEPKPFSTPITDISNIPSAPQPPEGKTLADKLVERDVTPGSAAAPEGEELDEEIHRREIATEFYKARNRLVHQNGGFVNDDEQEMIPIEDEDPPKRISKFRAARMR
ncbi:hypothetical protein N7474_008261 [Penicillium riverlandense]|uniref:uncharacterized protein n=1 Tax=Penicillium riverlandense TaxID=1903569 RepID=UPI0025472DB2|nr:uncharacterized protein N7474_008261 [Penicillium riverlandense]KAJ5811960.1 hypothetical protein N7474_008261 [Penicillium riverlandense]